MRRTVRTAPLARALGIARSRIEQWIGRGILEPEHKTRSGVARQWTFADAVGLAILGELADARIPLDLIKDVGPHLQRFQTSRGGGAFLLLIHADLDPVRMRRGRSARTGGLDRDGAPGPYRSALVKGRDLFKALDAGGPHVALVIALGAMEERVKSAWVRATGAE